ncbi:MAG: hypothetical protein JHD16_15105 [Solirubrobacteraceae bacterium]|nr:hypothetical protein [Solirubrobacteraceae bacterium]
MTVPAETTTPAVRPTSPAGAPAARSPRRHGAASRHVGAAGQTRRNLQRDLARREASLRISRRVSGPAEGVTRPPLADVPTAQPSAPTSAPAAAPFNEPVDLPLAPQQISVTPAPAGAFDVPSFVAAPVVRRVPRPQAPAPQRAARPAPQQRATVAQPQARVAPATPAPGPATAVAAAAARPRPLAAAASALAAAPARLPLSLPQRPRLTVLPGGLVETAPAGRRRVSTPAVMVAAITIVILTFGAILGLQISKTQVNAQMGSDLTAISTLQQKVTATREKLNRASASANVDGEARSKRLVEPDLRDVRFTRVGGRAAAAERARRLLEKAPVAPTAAQLKAAADKAKAAQPTAATGTVTGTAGGAVQSPSDTAASMTSVPDQTAPTGAAQPAPTGATSATGAGVTQ